MVFVFLCFPIGALLNACSKQTRHTVNLGIVAIFSFVANLAFVLPGLFDKPTIAITANANINRSKRNTALLSSNAIISNAMPDKTKRNILMDMFVLLGFSK